jgi:hypothetical protein
VFADHAQKIMLTRLIFKAFDITKAGGSLSYITVLKILIA